LSLVTVLGADVDVGFGRDGTFLLDVDVVFDVGIG